MEVIIIKIGFIGAGKVGFTLGKYLKINDFDVIGYYSRSERSSFDAAQFTESNQFINLESIVQASDVIIITTPDDKIEEVWKEIKLLPIKEKIICHCSGSLSSHIFSQICEESAFGYSIHPMFPISDKYNSYKNFKEAFITIEGDERYISHIQKLVSSLGNRNTIIKAEDKAKYHLASVMSSNLVTGLINLSVKYLNQCGFDNDEAVQALYPLIKSNIDNIKGKGVVNSLTGPIERGDISTISKHKKVIAKEDMDIYMNLSKEILEIAKIKNKERDYFNLEEYLEG